MDKAKDAINTQLSNVKATASIPFFEAASSWVPNIESYFHEYSFKKSSYLFWEGDPADTLYIIKTGRVRLFKTSAGGNKMVLDVMVPGKICGAAMLFSDVHINSAQAVENTGAYGMTRERYIELLENYPKLAIEIIKYLGTRLRDAHDVIISLVSSNVESRIATVILKLCENHGTPTEEGILANVQLTRQDIADIVGSTVETTVRIISRLQKEGLLATIKGRLLVKDMDALVRIARAGG